MMYQNQLPPLPQRPEDFGELFHNLAKLFSVPVSLPSSPVIAPAAIDDTVLPEDMADEENAVGDFMYADFIVDSPQFFVPNSKFATVDLHFPNYLNLHAADGTNIAVLKCDVDVTLSPLTTGKTKHKDDALYLLPGHHRFYVPDDLEFTAFHFVMRSLDFALEITLPDLKMTKP